MSISRVTSYNGVNQARGMQGTGRSTSATFAGMPGPGMPTGIGRATAPQYPNHLGANPVGSSYTKGLGMGGIVSNQIGQQNNGVQPGQQMPSAVPQQMQPPPIQFDPNDPNNAALAGYMHGAGPQQQVPPQQNGGGLAGGGLPPAQGGGGVPVTGSQADMYAFRGAR